MILIALSILCGFIGIFFAWLLGIDGSIVNEHFAFALWMIGFLSPGLYVLNKLYEELKKRKS